MILNTLKHWLALAVAVTVLAGLVYAAGQQVLRMNANDPQIQLAEDAAAALAAGQPAAGVVPAAKVDIAQSLAPYLVVYDQAGKPTAASGLLHGQMPDLPAGVFDAVRQQGEDRITWQPEPGVRSAAVVVPVGSGAGGFVVAGRSLREVEARVDNLGKIALLGWLAALAATLVATGLLEMAGPRHE